MQKIISKAKIIFYAVLNFVFNVTLTKASNLHLTEKELGRLILIFIISSIMKLIIIAVFIYCLAYHIFIVNNKNKKKFSKMEKIIMAILTFIIYFIYLELLKG
jgi:hypothetical protein